MKIRTFIIYLFLCLTASAALHADEQKSTQEKYIERFASLAVEEMYRSGVPASITLAQGLLESRYGLSDLAAKGNNHFGIKCHNNWQGGRMYHDDDAKGECFRKYDSPEQSYRDHSDFLRYRDRYKFLFDYDVTDYKAWAHGLKKAGYATDPAYPSKLIRLIEEYELHEYDLKPDKKSDRKSRKKAKDKADEQVTDVLPEPPLQIEAPRRMAEDQRHVFRFNVAREVYVRNGVPYVLSVEGDTYEGLAASNNLFLREILKFNDLSGEERLLPGTVVYLQPKKKQGVKGLEKHVVEEGDSMRDIAQRYGIKLARLYKINGMSPTDVVREGDIIKLRK
jgi:LysM repeat protein